MLSGVNTSKKPWGLTMDRRKPIQYSLDGEPELVTVTVADITVTVAGANTDVGLYWGVVATEVLRSVSVLLVVRFVWILLGAVTPRQ